MKMTQNREIEQRALSIVGDKLCKVAFKLERCGITRDHIAEALIGFTMAYTQGAFRNKGFDHIELLQAYIDDIQKEIGYDGYAKR